MLIKDNRKDRLGFGRKQSLPWLCGITMGWVLWTGWNVPSVQATLSPHFTPKALVESAQTQIGQTVDYDGRYQRLSYPMGDVPLWTGVCSDVVIRALRDFHFDLQKEVSQCIAHNQSVFAKHLTKGQADRSIDHRRVKVLHQFFRLRGWTQDPQSIQPGDIVIMDLGRGQWHIAIVSNKRSQDKTRWLVIHNWGKGVQEEDILQDYPPLHCFRAPPKIIRPSRRLKSSPPLTHTPPSHVPKAT